MLLFGRVAPEMFGFFTGSLKIYVVHKIKPIVAAKIYVYWRYPHLLRIAYDTTWS